jgi:hypothetical protein
MDNQYGPCGSRKQNYHVNAMSDPDEPFGAEVARKGTSRRLKISRKSYDQILNRLWAGNSAGALAAIGALGARVNSKEILIAFCVFLVGLISLGVGSFASLLSQVRILRDWENAQGILEVKASNIMKPSEEAGFRFGFQNVTAIIALLMFLAGMICGLVVAYNAFQ